MRITFISLMEDSPWGGSELLWYKVAYEALENGHQIQICVKKFVQPVPQILTLEKKGAKVLYRVKPNHNSLFIRIKTRLFKKNKKDFFLKRIKEFNPNNILISQGGTFDFFAYTSIYNFILNYNKPIHLISQFNYENSAPLNSELVSRVNESKKLIRKFYFVSERNKSTALRQFGGQLNNTSIVSNPVNLKSLVSCEWPKTDLLQMACIARYNLAIKGQDILLQALSEINFKKFRLDFYGTGPHEKHLVKLIHFYNLQEHVFVNQHTEDMDSLWAKYHVLLLPSIAEGTPLSLQEAMLKGRPALVTDVGGNRTLIEDGVNGFLAECASVNCLKAKLVDLFNTDLKVLKAMGEKSAIKAKKEIKFRSYVDIMTDLTK